MPRISTRSVTFRFSLRHDQFYFPREPPPACRIFSLFTSFLCANVIDGERILSPINKGIRTIPITITSTKCLDLRSSSSFFFSFFLFSFFVFILARRRHSRFLRFSLLWPYCPLAKNPANRKCPASPDPNVFNL